MENGPFIDGLPIKSGDFPWLTVKLPEGKFIFPLISGVGNCPILDILDITNHNSHGVDHIPNDFGWVM